MQLTVQQPDLSQMFGNDSLYNTLYGMQRQDQATANNNQNLGQAAQDQSFQADMHPLDMGLAQANIGHTQALTANANAQTPGMIADSTMKTNAANADSSVPSSIRNNVALTKYLATASAQDLQDHADRAMTDLYSPDPKVRADAQKVQMSLPAVQARLAEIRAQGANEYAVSQLNNTSREKIDANDVTNGKYGRNTANYLIQKGLTEGYPQQSGAWTAMAMNADQDGRTDLALQYRQLADAARSAGLSDKAASAYTALASKLNVAGLIGGTNVVNAQDTPMAQDPSPAAASAPVAPVATPPLAGGLVTVIKPDGTRMQIRAEGLAHLPAGWKKG